MEKNVEKIKPIHKSVLLNEILEYIPDNTKLIVDWTIWHWWHIEWILGKFEKCWKIENVFVIWIDRDADILDISIFRLNKYKNKILFINKSYSDLLEILDKNKLWKIDYLILDLWVNLQHFKDPNRWFSLKNNWDLDMRFDQKQFFNAKNLINTYKKSQIEHILQKYWDFNKKIAQKIANEIFENRKKKEIHTTFDLKDILSKKCWLNDKKIAVVFQCIRIEVNKELDELEKFLNQIPKIINNWWRCSIITYHSIEDRIVKNYFLNYCKNWQFWLITKNVIKPNYLEIKQNKASRSAKLRIIQKN